jgi:hypothetical protein
MLRNRHLIGCPGIDACAVNGVGAQGAPTTPIYTLRVPGNAA